jgi:hypothetical protein
MPQLQEHSGTHFVDGIDHRLPSFRLLTRVNPWRVVVAVSDGETGEASLMINPAEARCR